MPGCSSLLLGSVGRRTEAATSQLAGAVIAPGTLVTMIGTNLAARDFIGDASGKNLPLELGDVQAYFDGIRSPLFDDFPPEARQHAYGLSQSLVRGSTAVPWVRTT